MMCYAIPGKLVGIQGNIGTVDYFGEKRRVLVDADASIGDYVYAQGGIIINKISEEKAIEILNFWKDKFFELKEIDKKFARIDIKNTSSNILEILQRSNLGKELQKEELLALLQTTNKGDLRLLYETANNIRQKEHDNACCVHGIVEFSNYCKLDCHYCGIRKSKKLRRYRMSVDEIINNAKQAANLGFKAIVLQSGEDLWYDEKKLVKIVREIRKLGVLIFLSIGERSMETYKKLYDAGARAVLLRFETSNKSIFEGLRPNTNIESRLELIRYLKKIGYILATGFIIGLPDEKPEDIIKNILLTKSLRADMYSFGPFIAAKDTPLEHYRSANKDIVLKTIAITRLVDKKSKILVTTALETLDSNAKKEGLLAGANSLMLNITPKKYRRLYEIYNNRAQDNIDEKDNIKDTINLLYSIGRAPTDLGI